MREYGSDLQTWKSGSIANYLNKMQMAFKIVPVADSVREKDSFPFTLKNETLSIDEEAMPI